MLATATIKALTEVFDSATIQVQQLFQLLEAEQQALLAEDHDQLERLIEQKLRLSQGLDYVEIQRQEIMARAGQATAPHSMQDIFDTHKQHAAYTPLITSWDHMLAWLKKAAEQNQLNGVLMEQQRQHVQRALSVLFEQSNNTAVYDAAGGTTQGKYSRSVGVA